MRAIKEVKAFLVALLLGAILGLFIYYIGPYIKNDPPPSKYKCETYNFFPAAF